MAPKGSGGRGRGRGGGGSVCEGAFDGTGNLPYFICTVITLAVMLVIFGFSFKLRRRHASAKKLLGWAYILSIAGYLISAILSISETLVSECHTGDYRHTYYRLALVDIIFFNLGFFMLLVVLVFTLPSLLFRFGDASGRFPRPLRMASLAALGLMGLYTIAKTAIQCYNYWIVGFYDYGYSYTTQTPLFNEQYYMGLAHKVFVLVLVLAGMGASLVAVSRGRRNGSRVGGLLPLVGAMTFCMCFFAAWGVAASAITVENVFVEDIVYIVLGYLNNLFFAMTYVLLLMIGKSEALRPGSEVAQLRAGSEEYINTASQLPEQHPVRHY